MTPVSRTSTMFSLEQAVDSAPSLAALQQRVRHSQQCLGWILPLLPSGLRKQVKAGPIQEKEWCLLVSNAAVSTKLRQLLPVLLATLKEHDAQVDSIRIKVQVGAT